MRVAGGGSCRMSGAKVMVTLSGYSVGGASMLLLSVVLCISEV